MFIFIQFLFLFFKQCYELQDVMERDYDIG